VGRPRSCELGQDRHNGRVTSPYPQTPHTSPARSAQRVSYDRETVHSVLDEALICHVGFVVEGDRWCYPTCTPASKKLCTCTARLVLVRCILPVVTGWMCVSP